MDVTEGGYQPHGAAARPALVNSQRLRRARTPITYPAVGLRAAVSRTFLYENPGARALVTDAIAASGRQRARAVASADVQQEAI